MNKLKCFFLNNYWFLIALIVALTVQLFWFSSLSFDDLNDFFTSDTLYLPSLYRDWFTDGYTINGWTLNPAPNFFPDMLLFFILNFITGSFVHSAFWFSLIQFFAIITLCYLIFKTIKTNLLPATFAPAVLLFTSFLFALFFDHCFWESALLNNNSFHNGAFVMTLLCLLLFFLYLKNESKTSLIFFLILIAVCAPSDRLFFISLVAPLFLTIITLYVLNFERKRLKKTVLFLFIGAVSGFGIWYFCRHNSIFNLTGAYGDITTQNIKSSWHILWEQMYVYLTNRWMFCFLIILSSITYIGSIGYIVVRLKNHHQKDYVFAFQIFILFFTPVVFFAPILAGSYGGFDTFRYNFYPFILLPFNSLLLISNFLDNNKILRSTVNIIPLALIIIFFAVHLPKHSFTKGFNQYFTFYPAVTQYFDDYFTNTDTVKYCVTNDYWLAKKVTMFSKKNIRIYTMNEDLYPYLHVSNKHWFIDSDKGKYAHSQFTYIIWKKETELPDFFKETNPNLQPIDIAGYNLYKVAPFQFNEKDWGTPVLIHNSN